MGWKNQEGAGERGGGGKFKSALNELPLVLANLQNYVGPQQPQREDQEGGTPVSLDSCDLRRPGASADCWCSHESVHQVRAGSIAGPGLSFPLAPSFFVYGGLCASMASD